MTLRSRRGQIIIPAMFIFPTLFLFIFLIFETAKLSREKIRRQFAIDSAAFVEMTNYSDFLNRSAYVNGAFPMRIFYEGFHETYLDCLGRDPCPGKKRLDDILYADGVFPRAGDPDKSEFSATDPIWDIQYGGQRGGMNSDSPEVGSPDCDLEECVTLISKNTAQYWNINWDDANQIYKLYVQIYQLLGSVESAQYSVLKRLAAEHNFFKKSYWLNTGGTQGLAEAGDAVRNFRNVADASFPLSSAVRFHCAQHMYFAGNQLVHSWAQPYVMQDTSGDPPKMPSTISECSGLFQLVTVSKSAMKSMGFGQSATGYPGWPAEVQWTVGGNYFNVDFNNRFPNGRPSVHATVSVYGQNANVWYESGGGPTPKFQVRLYP